MVSERPTYEAGKFDNVKIFHFVYQIGSELAGYLGYDNIADMRRFVLSRNFLGYFVKYAGKWSKGLHRTGALEQIRDQRLKGKEDFPIDHKEARKHYSGGKENYSMSDATKRNKRLAHFLVLMVDDYDTCPANVRVVAAAQKVHMAELQALRPKICDEMPDMSNETVRLPKLKTKHEESELER